MTNSITGSGTPVEFVIVFEGDAVADHAMPVRDLAPALGALGEAFDRANQLLNGERVAVALEMRAPQQGSIEIVLFLQQLMSSAVPFMSGDFVSAAANLKDLFFTNGLFALLKQLRGSSPTIVPTDNGNFILEARDLRIVVPPEMLRLLTDTYLRKQLEAVVAPVENEGIERVLFREGRRVLESVAKDDVPSFAVITDNPQQTTTETIIPRQQLKPASVTFERDGKWRLSDGERTRWYAIKDEAFAEEVADGRRRFGSGDTLVCDVVARQSLNARGQLRMDYEVARVIQHRAANVDPSQPLI